MPSTMKNSNKMSNKEKLGWLSIVVLDLLIVGWVVLAYFYLIKGF